jgi:hypothetical protein
MFIRNGMSWLGEFGVDRLFLRGKKRFQLRSMPLIAVKLR